MSSAGAGAGTQTDAFLPRPPTPLFVPPKRGVDAETQIVDDELFDFDFEAHQPLTRNTCKLGYTCRYILIWMPWLQISQ